MIYTGYFDKIEEYKKVGLIPVCIAGYPPKGFKGFCYPNLAPKKNWWQEWHDHHLGNDWYEKKYQETILNKLSPFQVQSDMMTFGKSVIMLCYEEPNKFCHRHLVTKWLNNHRIYAMEYTHLKS